MWQRLNTTQAILVLLLVVGCGLAIWMERSTGDYAARVQKLAEQNQRIRNHLLQLSDALRGLLVDGANKAEESRRVDAESKLLSDLDNMSDTYQSHGELARAARRLRDFVAGEILPFHKQIIEMIKEDPGAAPAAYRSKHAEIQDQLDQKLRDLGTEANGFSDTTLARGKNVAKYGMIGIVVVLVACVPVFMMQSASVTVPLRQLVSRLEDMGRGDFSRRLDWQRKDEFGVLGEGLNRLADDLSVLVGQVQRSGILVNTSATEIAATAKEQQSTSHEIAATTAEIGATSKEISATSKELVKTMNEVSQVAADTADLASTGQNAINRMESNMRTIMDASGSISSKLAVLNEKTANINTMVTTITKVADQTNLLSLNAAIEAEKAGEYGLGFAVVAMEIRRLADQTAVATYDIEKMVKEMQSAVAAGVMGMDKFSEEVRHGVDEIRQVSTQLAQIIHQVQTLTPRVQAVDEGMHAQAAGAQQISETLVQLSESAHQTAESLRLSNIAIEQLNEAARGLQTSVARFKLEKS